MPIDQLQVQRVGKTEVPLWVQILIAVAIGIITACLFSIGAVMHINGVF